MIKNGKTLREKVNVIMLIYGAENKCAATFKERYKVTSHRYALNRI